jgi:ribosome-binding protein aMBF1 (putative translation factor)
MLMSPPLTAGRLAPHGGYSQPQNIRCWDTGKGGAALARVEKSIYSEEYRRLCAILRELRLAAGLTQVQVAARLDVPQSFVSKYESGERRLDVIELRHVADALGASLAVILERLGK